MLNMPSRELAYRPEIDCLRALAVSAVLIFHFFPHFLPLGYLGVDLFFVISGFLISSYIISENIKGTFSFSEFYRRRIKRILPATLSMLLLSFGASLLFLTPYDLTRYANSVVATLFFCANLYFWRSGGYFGSSDELKPLLHMWSLGVEEQFYLFFPLVVFIIAKLTSRVSYWYLSLGLLSLASLAINIYLLRIGGPNPAFFLLPARVWQFGFGALAAVNFINNSRAHGQAIIFIVFVAMCIGLFITPPLLPAGFIVTTAASYFLARRVNPAPALTSFLFFPFLRKIGIISFSLYLWHWPILVFIKYLAVDDLPISYSIAGLLATILLSLASFSLIEEPFRNDKNKMKLYFFLAASYCVLLALSAFTLYSDGIRWRYSKFISAIADGTQSNYRCPVSDYISYGASRACYINKSSAQEYDVALIGNSHAQMYVPSIQGTLISQGRKGLLIPLNGCMPTTDINISVDCLRLAKNNYSSYTNDARIKTVVFATTWYANNWVTADGTKIDDPERLILAESLLELIRGVESSGSGKDVYLVGPIQIPGYDLPSVLSRKLAFRHIDQLAALESLKIPRRQFDLRFGLALEKLSDRLGHRLILPHEQLCDQQNCFFGNSNTVFFSDATHLSFVSAKNMASIFLPALKSD